MSAFCGNPECPSNWADLPCTCPPETPLVQLPDRSNRCTEIYGGVQCLKDVDHEGACDMYAAAPVQLPQVAITVEAGPELFTPVVEGTVVPPATGGAFHRDWLNDMVWVDHAAYSATPGGMLDRLLGEVLASPESPDLTPEQALLVDLTVMLTEAQHVEGVCYITPDETECHCLIGKVKAVLPLCTATKLGPITEELDFGEYWRCVMIEHPDNPEHHHFEKA